MRKFLSRNGVFLIGLVVVVCLCRAQSAGDFYDKGIALEKSGKNVAAIAAFDESIALDSSRAEVFQHRGLCKARLGNDRGALADYSQAVKLDPRNALAWNGMAAVKIRAKDYDLAYVYVVRAIDIDPKLSSAYVNRGVVKQHQEDVAGALADYTKAITLDKNSIAGYFNRGLLRKKQNDFAGAIDDFTKVISLDKTYANAYANRGDILAKMGELAGAEADLKTALRLNPGNKNILTGLEDVKKQIEALSRPSTEPKEAAAEKQNNQGVPTAPTMRETVPAAKPLNRPAAEPTPDVDLNLPSIPFKPDQPCETAKLEVVGAPWQKAAVAEKTQLPAGIEPADIPALPAVMEISRARYAGAVAAAKESLRILYGPLSETEAKKFEAMWAPIFDFPSQNIIDYLNKLNPLLVRYLVGREALARAAIAFQGLLFEMSVVVGYQEESALQESLAYAERQRDFILSLQTGLARLGAEIAALGNPPNPLQAKCEAQRKYQKALEAADAEPDVNIPPAGLWEGTREQKIDLATQSGMKDFYDKLKSELNKVTGSCIGPLTELVYGPQPVIVLVSVGPENKWFDVWELSCSFGTISTISDYGDMLKREPQRVIQQGGGLKLDLNGSGNPSVLRRYAGGDSVPEVWAKETAKRLNHELTTGGNTQKSGFGAEYAVVDKYVMEILKFNQVRTAFAVAAAKYQKNPSLDTRSYERSSYFKSLVKQAISSGSAESEEIAKPSEARGTSVPTKTAASSEADKAAAAALREEIAYHQSLIEVLKKYLAREVDDLARANEADQKKAFAFRVIQLQSDIQSEQDLIASYEAGQVVHTRSMFEEYAHAQIQAEARREAAESDATWRIAQRIERQISLLPEDQRRKTREQVYGQLEAKTVASGDLPKARKVAQALNKQVEGYWEGEAAKNEIKAADAEENEFLAKLTVMAAGMVFVGMSGPAMVETFGPMAGVTLWAPTISGACYGGVTGYIEGGPGEALKQSLAWSSLLGYMTTEFYDGAKKAYTAPDGDLKKALTGGVTQAGTAYLTGKAFEYGANLLGKGAQVLFGKSATPTVMRQFDEARFNQDLKDAKSLVGFYQEKEFQLLKIKTNNPPGSAEIQKAEKEVQQLAASINSSYHAKLFLKNEGAPGARMAFNRRVDTFYEEMMPEFLANLDRRGFKMSKSDFVAMRNASSSGSVSMDLDLALKETPGMVIRRKNGEPVKTETFMKEAQEELNKAYHKVTKTSATRSNVNLTTSAHSESFADTRLLKEGVDFGQIKPEDIAQIGKVIQNKTINIEADPVLSPVAKVQAGCRESSKEIGNMLIPYLEFKINSAKASAQIAEFKQAKEHWTNIREKFVGLSQASSDGHKIWELEQEIRRLTGGKSVRQTINDLSNVFAELAKTR